MEFAQIAAMEPQRAARYDCRLHQVFGSAGQQRLRAVSVGYRPSLPKALELIEAWGFKYKTVGFYWAKTNKRANLGTGYAEARGTKASIKPQR